MNATQALDITVNAIRVDAVLSGEAVNLNRVTYWLSELSYGRKYMGSTLSMAGGNDIVRYAANVAENNYSAAELVAAASK